MNDSHPLTNDQVSLYDENGYLVIENVLPAEECDKLMHTFEQQADEHYSAILNLDRSLPEIRDVMKDRRIVAPLEQLQRAEVVGLMSQMLFKHAGSRYASQAWNPHQDNSYPQAEAGRYITVNIFFEHSDAENGGMYIYPGSHREGTLPFDAVRSYREDMGNNPGNTVVVPQKYKKVDLHTKRGDMLVLHGCVIHGSYPNKSVTRSRPLFSISYITRGASFIPGKNANRTPIELK